MKQIMTNLLRIAVVGVPLAACDSNVKTTRSIQPGNALILSAENRAILAVEQPRIDPNTLLRKPGETSTYYCAEPSPDALKVNSQEFAALLKGNFLGLGGASPEAAAEFASTFSESAGELGKRTASGQMIRDLLYRACEAGINGYFRPGGEYNLTRIVDGDVKIVPYSFDQLTTDVILQMDNLSLGLQAIDGLTGLSQQGKLVVTSTTDGVSTGDDGAETEGVKTTVSAPVIAQTVLSKEATEAIARAVVEVVAISLNEQNAEHVFKGK